MNHGNTERLLGFGSPFGTSVRNTMTEQALGVPRNIVEDMEDAEDAEDVEDQWRQNRRTKSPAKIKLICGMPAPNALRWYHTAFRHCDMSQCVVPL